MNSVYEPEECALDNLMISSYTGLTLRCQTSVRKHEGAGNTRWDRIQESNSKRGRRGI